MCNFEKLLFACGCMGRRLLSYCHFTRTDDLHQCFSVKVHRKGLNLVNQGCERCGGPSFDVKIEFLTQEEMDNTTALLEIEAAEARVAEAETPGSEATEARVAAEARVVQVKLAAQFRATRAAAARAAAAEARASET